MSLVAITQKSDGTVKTAADSIELNKQMFKKSIQPPLLAELLDQVFMEISENHKAKFYNSTIDLENAFGQIALLKGTLKHLVTSIVGGKATVHYRYKKRFDGLTEMPVVFQTKIKKVLIHETPAWQDDIIVEMRSVAKDHEAELTATLSY